MNLNKEIADSSEPVCEAGLVLAQPVVVRDAAIVHLLHELGILSLHQHRVQPLAAALLHTLEAEFEVDGNLEATLFVTLEGVYPAQHGAFVVSGASPVQLSVNLGEDPGVGVPTVLNGSWLDVKVTIDQQGLLAGVSAELSHEDGRKWQDSSVR